MRILPRLLGLSALAVLLPAPALVAQAAKPVPWVTLDARRTLPGEHDDYLAFIRANWQPARDEVMRQGHVLDYAVQVMPADSLAPGGWDVLLVTVYRDSTAAANAEAIFRPVIAARELVRINGKGPREMAIGLWQATTRLIGSPDN
jgi:hypothetical protein